MSATQDKTQKITFVYSNLYEIYRKGKEAAKAAPVAPLNPEAPLVQDAADLSSEALAAPLAVPAHSRGQVLKADDLRNARIEPFTPAELIGKRVARPAVLGKPAPALKAAPAIESLKQNLKSLNDLHERLRFMLAEIEELTKE